MAAPIFLSVAAVLAVWYGAILTHGPVSALRSWVKIGATGVLLGFAIFTSAPWIIALGLLFGVLGDGFLSRDREVGFLPGLGAFLIGHSLYAIWAGSLLAVTDAPLNLLVYLGWGALIVTAVAFWRVLSPALGALRLAVAAYFAVSTVLVVLALALSPLAGSAAFVLGVVMFVTSDIFLAIQLFLLNERSRWHPPVSTLLWALYWGAQVLILTGATQIAA